MNKQASKAAVEHGDVVIVDRGSHKGRIGYFDDDDDDLRRAVVYFGRMLYTPGYFCIAKTALRLPTMNDLVQRSEELGTMLAHNALGGKRLSAEKMSSLLLELNLVTEEMSGRHIRNRLAEAPSRTHFYATAAPTNGLFDAFLMI